MAQVLVRDAVIFELDAVENLGVDLEGVLHRLAETFVEPVALEDELLVANFK